MGDREVWLGDEAVAMAAVHAGISGVYGYPGTPSTEIFEAVEAVAAREGIHAHWSANEKVAYEEALGMSFAGRRSIVTMKHVGLNVAADAFMNSAVTGVHGGLVLAVADDPGMHSSQNEQDSRYYAHFALVPCLEPADQQQAYEMTREAFDLSEAVGLPVVLRLVTRLAHSRASVAPGPRVPQKPLGVWRDPMTFTLLPQNARIQYRKLTEKQSDLLHRSGTSRWNALSDGPRHDRGFVVNGIAWNYLMEAFGGDCPHPVLRIGQYPVPADLVRALVETVGEVVVVEEGYPYLEERLRGIVGIPGKAIRGKLDGTLPRTGELNPTIVAASLGLPVAQGLRPTLGEVPGRPPTLCPGCSHSDSFLEIREAMKPFGDLRVFADIGCYTLGFYSPLNAIHSCVDMGASISMAAGAAHAGARPVVAAIGDSTFAHSGITPLLTAIRQNVDFTVVILDNGTVAMTGTQKTLATGEDLERIVLGLGLDPEHLKVIEPHKTRAEEQVAIIRREIEYPGTSVIIARRACVQALRRGVA